MSPQPTDDDAAAKKRNKKRELDRRAQRAARARNRNRIANLEATIDLMSNNESGNSVAMLLSQLNDVTKERDELINTLNSIGDLIRRGIPAKANKASSQEELHVDEGPDNSPFNGAGHIPFGHASVSSDSGNPLLAVETDNSLFEMPPLPSPTPACQIDPSLVSQENSPSQDSNNFASSSPTTDDVIVPESQFPCDCVPPDSTKSPARGPSSSIWRAANSILGRPETPLDCDLKTEDEICEDLPIKAILGGWNEVESDASSSALWRKLRQIDELQFRGCPNVERLGILVLMHRVLRYRADPDHNFGDKFPPWLLQRPSQSLPHSSAIDFFVWPGVRERFVFSQHQYCSNNFWKVFADCFRLAWPFEFRDCYMTNLMTGRYSLSPQFESHIQKITNWTMNLDFFTHFPEMYGDIPSFQEVPRLIPEERQVVRRQQPENHDDNCYPIFKISMSDSRTDMLSFLALH